MRGRDKHTEREREQTETQNRTKQPIRTSHRTEHTGKSTRRYRNGERERGTAVRRAKLIAQARWGGRIGRGAGDLSNPLIINEHKPRMGKGD